MDTLTDELLNLRWQTKDEFRKTAVDKQHSKGELTARERLEKLLDTNSFLEIGNLTQPSNLKGDYPADGVVIGTGKINGRLVCCASYDYTVLGGSQGQINHKKVNYIVELAIEQGCPIIFFSEGGGARVQDISLLTRDSGQVFTTLAKASGWIPTICVVPGPAFAGHANIASLCDLLIFIEGSSSMGIAGPPLVRAAMGANFSPEELGGTQIQEESGAPDLIVKDEEEAIESVKTYLSYFPSNYKENLPVNEVVVEPERNLSELVPSSKNRAYNMKTVIRNIVDVDSMFELKDYYGKSIITSLARLDGNPIGVIANQPSVRAGVLDSEESNKMARFISLCDAFNIPLTFLVDVPGFTPSIDSGKKGLLRQSARILVDLAHTTVPIYTVVLRKAYGLGYYAMGSWQFKPSLVVAWPTAEFGSMGLEGGVETIYKDVLEKSNDSKASRKRMSEELEKDIMGIKIAQKFAVDDVIHPDETRSILQEAISRYKKRNVSLPPKKHSVMPI
ncbi:acyl-CoA carboxylase subunit beta [Oceanobacillus salinisoli]|uniref:acyl-CoA carboxylase subunit beta n=1 Tax=Oceanobacillus salinisoli TaxID=2678611 RepID=UPI0012E2A276|nr:carboxyl transferase domain-containing protein [Oceanobacillus salinisoli]